MDNEMPMKNEGQILLYQTEDGKVSIDVYFESESFWM